ncbi:hypothetical protein [Glutamicibacter sp. NPDC087344]|uniref:hypothetical protein n=1 Tax=Glutamicibacter sp. NPDC087344 TaxID=3363994 RepID=UPI00381FD363
MKNRMIGKALDFLENTAERLRAMEQSKQMLKHIEAPGFREGVVHVITGSRQEGKTKLALQWLMEDERRVLITCDAGIAQYHAQRAGLPRKQDRVISYRQLLHRGPVPGAVYGIDETVEILTRMLGLREDLHLITVATCEEWQC